MDTNPEAEKVMLKKISKLPAEIGRRDFSEVLEAMCGYKIIPIDPIDANDKKLLDTIKKAMDNFMEANRKSETRYRANRVNDVGSKMESAIVEEMKKTALNPHKLSSTGHGRERDDDGQADLRGEYSGPHRRGEGARETFYLTFLWH